MTSLTTPPLPPKTIQMLHQLGIDSVEALREMGAVTAFLLLKANKLSVTEHLLWQLIGLTDNCSPFDLSEQDKSNWRQKVKNHAPVACFPTQEEMHYWMRIALQQAEKAYDNNEIPVGAVVVYDQQLIGMGFNQCIAHHNISHHAEIQALASAGKVRNNYRLDNCDVYVTLEPCAMCASALIQARISRVIFGAAEPKTGAAGSILNLFNQNSLNKHTALLGGILADNSLDLLKRFFQYKR